MAKLHRVQANLIVCSAHSYRAGMRFGTSYLAEALAARGWQILFLEQPTSLLHLASRRARPVAVEKLRDAARATFGRPPKLFPVAGAGAVTVARVALSWPHVNRPLFRSRLLLDHWWRMTVPSITRLLRQSTGSATRAVLFDSPFFFPLVRRMEIASIYRYADRMQYFGENAASLITLQQQVFREASLVAYTAKSLLADLETRSGPTLYLPNGVDLSAFELSSAEPPELGGIPHPRAIYCGTIGSWFDFDAVNQAVAALPEIQFVMVGPQNADPRRLKPAGNLHVLGKVPQGRVPSFLGHCDLALIPFDMRSQRDFVEAINPLKLYEYCAAGLPTVSYLSAETAGAGSHVRFYSGPNDLAEQLRLALSEASPRKAEARRRWARSRSWDIRAADLEAEIERLRA